MSIARKMQHALVAAVAVAAALLVPAVSADAATVVRVSNSGDLTITGDNGPQIVSIIDGNGNGRFTVKVVHGGVEQTHNVVGATRNVTINLKGGEDIVVLKHPSTLRFLGNLTVKLGNGSNGFHTESPVKVPGSFKITDGSGESYMEIADMRVDGPTTYSLGGGNNVLYASGNRFQGTFLASSSASGRISLSSADDYYKKFTFRGGNNRDVLKLSSGTEFGGSAAGTIDLRGGNDELTARNHTQFMAPMTVKMGSGIDTAHFSNVQLRESFVFRGDGGNDTLDLFGVSAYDAVTIDGGSGTDTIGGEAWSSVQTAQFIGWETFN